MISSQGRRKKEEKKRNMTVEQHGQVMKVTVNNLRPIDKIRRKLSSTSVASSHQP
jgi:hypothetical protein